MSSDAQLVFGYGSLLARLRSHPEHARVHPGRLLGYRRAWNIAMDNSVDLPGYKYYETPDGHRPSVFVTFLNLVAHAHGRVNGILFEASASALQELDLRERNYERVEVTSQLDGAPAGTIWTYVGSADARQRYETGLAQSRAMVSRAYYEGVRQGFAALGATAVSEFEATTDPPACPVGELRRIDLTGACLGGRTSAVASHTIGHQPETAGTGRGRKVTGMTESSISPRIHVITLGVDDLERALAFYRDGLGWETQGIVGTDYAGDDDAAAGAVAMFTLADGLILSLYPRSELAKDAGVSPLPRGSAISLGHFVERPEEVDAVLALADQAGGRILGAPHNRPWGIYSGYFSDPDEHLWEVIYPNAR